MKLTNFEFNVESCYSLCHMSVHQLRTLKVLSVWLCWSLNNIFFHLKCRCKNFTIFIDTILVHKHHISTSYLSSMQKVCLNGLNWIFFRVIFQKKKSLLTGKTKDKFYTGPPTFRTAWFNISCHVGSRTLCSLDVETSFCSAMDSIFLAAWCELQALSYFSAAFWVSICDL